MLGDGYRGIADRKCLQANRTISQAGERDILRR